MEAQEQQRILEEQQRQHLEQLRLQREREELEFFDNIQREYVRIQALATCIASRRVLPICTSCLLFFPSVSASVRTSPLPSARLLRDLSSLSPTCGEGWSRIKRSKKSACSNSTCRSNSACISSKSCRGSRSKLSGNSSALRRSAPLATESSKTSKTRTKKSLPARLKVCRRVMPARVRMSACSDTWRTDTH